MNALAHIPPARLVDRSAGFRPTDVTAIGLLINRLGALEKGPRLDADVFLAMGWEVSPPSQQRACWRVRSPFSRLWMPLPPVSTTMDGAAILSVPGWDYGLGRRGGQGYAVVRDRADHTRFFEATFGEPPQCLTRCWLHAWRFILLENDR
ncbi:MAG: hypothetical protein JWP29_5682 [Rhodoferax sp.]|nr:hypothetical protein [Rhodoferax sp.]